MTVEETLALMQDFIQKQRISNGDWACAIYTDRRGKIIDLALSDKVYLNAKEMLEVSKKYPYAKYLKIGFNCLVEENPTYESIMKAITSAFQNLNTEAREHGEPADEPVIAAVVASKTGKCWVTLSDDYRAYAGIHRRDTAAPTEAAAGCPAPNSYNDYPIVGLWIILPVVADDINVAGGFKPFDSQERADYWLTQNGGEWIGNE